MNPTFSFSFVAVLCTTLVSRAANPITLDTTPYWANSTGVEVLTETGTRTCGQSFTAPAGAGSIFSFSFWVVPEMNPGPVNFTANLVMWDGSKPVGPLLYASAPVTASGPGYPAFQQFRFQFPDIPVQAGQQYMAFLTTAGVPSGAPGAAYIGITSRDVLSGGQACVNSLYTTVPEILQGGWSYLQPSTDYAFRAEFAPVPEPGVGAFVGLSLVGMGVFKVRFQTPVHSRS